MDKWNDGWMENLTLISHLVEVGVTKILLIPCSYDMLYISVD